MKKSRLMVNILMLFGVTSLLLTGCGGGGGGTSGGGGGSSSSAPAQNITVSEPAQFGSAVYPMSVDVGNYSYGLIYGGFAPEKLNVDENGTLLFPVMDESVEGTPQLLYICDQTTGGGSGIQCNQIQSIRCSVTSVVYGSTTDDLEVHCFLNDNTAYEKVFTHTTKHHYESALYIGFQQSNSLQYLTNPIEYDFDPAIAGL